MTVPFTRVFVRTNSLLVALYTVSTIRVLRVISKENQLIKEKNSSISKLFLLFSADASKIEISLINFFLEMYQFQWIDFTCSTRTYFLKPRNNFQRPNEGRGTSGFLHGHAQHEHGLLQSTKNYVMNSQDRKY